MLKDRTIRFLEKRCRPMRGQTVVITGANSGIGFKAAEELIHLGAKIIMACRSLSRASAAMYSLLTDYPYAEIEVRQLDLASRSSIQAFVEGIVRDGVDVHAFVHNAGIFRIHGVTEDGEDIVMGTNFTGVKILSELLLPYLESLPHAVNMTFTTSVSFPFGAKESGEKVLAEASDFKKYASSKRRLTRYARELAERCEAVTPDDQPRDQPDDQLRDQPRDQPRDHHCASSGGVSIILTHPGISVTPIAVKAYGEKFMARVGSLGSLFFQSSEKSALTIPYALTNDVKPGSIIGPRGFLNCWGLPSANRLISGFAARL